MLYVFGFERTGVAVGDLYFAALYELGLILFVITTIVLALAKFMLMRLGRHEGATT